METLSTPDQQDKTNGRRTERLMLEIPIRVLSFDKSAGNFSEESHTIFVNRDGALIALKSRVAPGETVRIINLENLREADFRVVGTARKDTGDTTEWGVECLEKARTLWDIDFPPPLSTGSEKAGALMECLGCNKQALRVLTLTEVGMLESVGSLEQLCDSCGELSTWAYADVARRPKKVIDAISIPAPQLSQPDKWDGRKERRLHKRVALKLSVLVQNQMGQREIAKTEDISKGGFSVCLGIALTIGDLVVAVCPYTAGGNQIEQKVEVRRRVSIYSGQKSLFGFKYVAN